MSQNKDWQRFRYIRELGAGGFGRTLLVADRKAGNRRVVIKIPHNKETEKALLQELINQTALAASLKKIDHPNIVRLHGFDLYEEYYVIILEYVPGGSLRQRIGPVDAVRSPMKVSDAEQLLIAICSGLEAAHSIGLVHRDIKPDNILLTRENTPKIIDFGISKILDATSAGSGTVIGTYFYMAPEAFAGKATQQSDLWSLSVMMYELVTGRLPFFDANAWELKNKVDKQDPPSPSSLNPAIDDVLETLILKGLAKNTKDRFQTAAEMIEFLSRRRGAPEHGAKGAQSSRSEEPQYSALDREILEIRRIAREGGMNQAEEKLRKLLQQHPGEVSVYLLCAELFTWLQQLIKAEEVLQDGLKKCKGSPQIGNLYYQLALSLWGRRQIEAAKSAMKKAIDSGLDDNKAAIARKRLLQWR